MNINILWDEATDTYKIIVNGVEVLSGITQTAVENLNIKTLMELSTV